MRGFARACAAALVAVIAIGLAACGSSGGGSSGNGSTTNGDNAANGAGSTCNPIAPASGFAGYYTACVNSGDTYFRLTNDTQWVFILQVPAGAALPVLTTTPPGGSSLADMVIQEEFRSVTSADYAIVAPGGRLTATSLDGAPVHLTIGTDLVATAANVSAIGLVDVIGSRVNPSQAEAQAIVACSDYVRSLPQQDIQSQPTTAQFWNDFSGTAECSHAFSTASDALGLGGDSVSTQDSDVVSDAEGFTSDFFEDVLPRLMELATETLFH